MYCEETLSSSENNVETSFGSEFYKKPGTKNSQKDRREVFLNIIQSHRNCTVDQKRGIFEVLEDSLDLQEIQHEEPMEVCYYHKKKRKAFGYKLMLSEYLREKPEDLEYKWCFKLCPKGHRNLVVASNKTTKAFSRQGKLLAEFKSLLPGGGPKDKSRFTLLDCIYNLNSSTYYVLDVLAWNSNSVVKCSSDFRFFFLKSKLEENPEISSVSSQNKYPFMEVSSTPAEINLLEVALSRPYELEESNVPLDGVLFYHTDMIYKAGITPLVGWVKPFKIPEVFGIPVHKNFMKKLNNCDNEMMES